MKALHVVGARPNFVKCAPVVAALREIPGVEQVLVHTGQHYDHNMSDVFFRQLGMPEPDVNLGVGSNTHAKQTAAVIAGLEEVLLAHRPDVVIVYGDINSTLAAALVAAKLSMRVAHVEAGLRSYDRSMPEEINRIVTDQLSDLLFTPSVDGNENLVAEGVPRDRIHFVGNAMVDTLVRFLPDTESRWLVVSASMGIEKDAFAVATLHRPSNVDDPDRLTKLMRELAELARADGLRVVFPMHPRTRERVRGLGLEPDGIHIIEPVGYIEFLALQRFARYVITDSGGIQEETTFLGTPCFTLRRNTERPITVTHGTNTLVGEDAEELLQALKHAHKKHNVPISRPLLWDGRSALRIAGVLVDRCM